MSTSEIQSRATSSELQAINIRNMANDLRGTYGCN